MKKNFSPKISRRFKALLFCCFVFLTTLLFLGVLDEREKARGRLKPGNDKKEIKICSHQEPGVVSLYIEWKCDYCGEIINNIKNVIRTFEETRRELNDLVEKHLQVCEEVKKFTNFLDTTKIRGQTYDNEETLREKQYPKLPVEQIKEWGLINRVFLPNLEEEESIGAAKVLSVVTDKKGQVKSANASDRLTFFTPSPELINIQNFPDLFTKISKKREFFYTGCRSRKINTYERIIAAFFVWKAREKGGWNFNIYKLGVSENVLGEKFIPVVGESGTVSFYLSLLSAYHQKPISWSVVATAFLEIGDYSQFNYCPWCFQEEVAKDPPQQFSKVKISPVDGLEYKIPAAVEKGVKKLILSSKQQANYEQVVPFEIREKLKVYYVKNVEELEELFWKGEFS